MRIKGCSAAVVGGGPAGLMAAEVLAAGGACVTVYDRMPSLGRKLLLAGRGGLNLTHSEDLARFLGRYGSARERLSPAIEALPPAAVRAWCEELGQPTFVGTSGRVFPVAMKASPLLRAWLARLDAAGVAVRTRWRWLGWSDDQGRLVFATPDGRQVVAADAVVLALGGASWPRLGSTGDWVSSLAERGIAVAPLVPANCGFLAAWSDVFRTRFEGRPLKRIALTFAGTSVRGEALITAGGIEGGAVYALSGALRNAIAADGAAELHIDLRPDMSAGELAARLGKARGKQSLATFLRKTGLSPVEIGLLHETAPARLAAMAPEALAQLIKAVPLRLTGAAPIATAISSAGGVTWDEVDAQLMLRRLPGVFVAGEMLDWEAPTGGYLLQACLSTGALAGRGALHWLGECPLSPSPSMGRGLG
jgi:uncharacterized flavoprotein (TIGR03862 family)